jgi:hypothetical protein
VTEEIRVDFESAWHVDQAYEKTGSVTKRDRELPLQLITLLCHF